MKITLREKIITIGFLFSVGCTAQDFIVDDIGYNRLANNTVEVTAKRSMHYVGDVTIPKKADTHIQNTAPGPPVRIAEITPIIFPVPTVPEIAVEKASN